MPRAARSISRSKPAVKMDDLFSGDLRTRISSAQQYSVFAKGIRIPKEGEPSWSGVLSGRQIDEGHPWPTDLARACSEKFWPQHAFGTANAAILILWHRPGLGGSNTLHFLPPRVPNLGGVPNAHVLRYVPDIIRKDKSWDLLHKWLGSGLGAFNIQSPWASVMVACLNPIPSGAGNVDRGANRNALSPKGHINFICQTVRPLLILACGKPVREAIEKIGWEAPSGKVVKVDHPSTWEGYGTGRRDGPDRVVPLFSQWAKTGRF